MDKLYCPVYGMLVDECPTREKEHIRDDDVCPGRLVAKCIKEQEESDAHAMELMSIEQDHEDAIWNRGEDW